MKFKANDIVTPNCARGFYAPMFGKEYTVLDVTGSHIRLVEIGEDTYCVASAWDKLPPDGWLVHQLKDHRACGEDSRLRRSLNVEPGHVTSFKWPMRPGYVLKPITLNLHRKEFRERLHLEAVRFSTPITSVH